MDLILGEFRHFCRAYVDDVVVYSATLEEHRQHLEAAFERFQTLGIRLKPSEAFIGHPLSPCLAKRLINIKEDTESRRPPMHILRIALGQSSVSRKLIGAGLVHCTFSVVNLAVCGLKVKTCLQRRSYTVSLPSRSCCSYWVSLIPWLKKDWDRSKSCDLSAKAVVHGRA